MWHKRLSLILFLVGLAFFIDISVRGIRSAVDTINSLEIYKKQAIDYQLSPALAEAVKKQLNEDNRQEQKIHLVVHLQVGSQNFQKRQLVLSKYLKLMK